MIRTLLITTILISFSYAALREFVSVSVGETAIMELPQKANYRRLVGKQEHIYRVCNGKNKKTCGFWENVKTKKKVASGVTTYNKNKKALIVKKVRESDFGTYMIGDKTSKIDLVKAIVFVEDEEEEEKSA